MKNGKDLVPFHADTAVAIRGKPRWGNKLALAMLRVFRKTFGLLALALAALGFGVAVVNPLPWIAHLLPIKLATAWGLIQIEE